jgi:hypothetical protein
MGDIALRFRDQKGRCFYCRRPMSLTQPFKPWEGPRATREHLVPRSQGGRGGANVVAACVRCNNRRGDQPWLPFLLAFRADTRPLWRMIMTQPPPTSPLPPLQVLTTVLDRAIDQRAGATRKSV